MGAGIEKEESVGQRYLVCSRDQYSTFELVEIAKQGAPDAATGVDLDAWRADEKVQAMQPKKPATDNRKACGLLGVDDLEQPAKFVAEAAVSLQTLEGPKKQVFD